MRIGKIEPFWLTLVPPVEGDEEAPNGVRAKFFPVSRSARRHAAEAAREALGPGIDLKSADIASLLDAGEAGSRELIRRGLLDQPEPEWEGMLDLDGKPLPVTDETVSMALDNDEFFEAADRLFVLPIAERDRAKNGLPASPGGTGGAGTRGSGTASSRATPRRKAAAKSARTPNTRSTAKRKRSSRS